MTADASMLQYAGMRLFRRKFASSFLPIFLLCFLIVLPVFAQIPDDPYLFEQWYLDAIHAPAAWEETTGSPDVIVAVLDAGFDLDHPDLVGQYWQNTRELVGNNKDDDNNGFEDDTYGWDFVDGDPMPEPQLGETFNDTVASHGTVIAGIIAATAENDEGITGIAPRVKIMPLRILDENGSGSTSEVRQAIVYAVRNGAQVINLSFTSDRHDPRLQEAIEWAVAQGVVVVTAVGNGGRDLQEKPSYPACFDLHVGYDLVLSVAASDRAGRKASFSNFGAGCTDVVASGTNVFGAVYHDPSRPFTATAYGSPWEGTSIAAPMVTGAVALIKSRYPLLTPAQVHLAVKLSVDPVLEVSVEARKQLGAGRLHVARALEAARVFAREGVRGGTRGAEHSRSFVVAQGRGSEPLVRRFDARGREVSSFLAYHRRFRGGVSVAVGDVDGDGKEEIVTGARAGGGPQVRVFDVDGRVRWQFFADDPSDRGGIQVGVGDTDGDGAGEIFVTPERGGTGEIRVFNRLGHLQGLIRPFGFVDGTLRLAFGNMDDDPEDELLVSWSGDTRAQVRVMDRSGRYLRDLPVSSSLIGAEIASADVDGDGMDEVIVAATRGRPPAIEVYSPQGAFEKFITAFAANMRTGLDICAGDIDQNGRAELYAVPLAGGGPQVQMMEGNGQSLGSFFAFETTSRSGLSCAIL